MSDDVYYFKETPNPAPVQGSTVHWTTGNHNKNTYAWTSSDDTNVTVRGTDYDNKNANVTAVGNGRATISARSMLQLPPRSWHVRILFDRIHA